MAFPNLTLRRAVILSALVAAALCLPILGSGFAIDDAYLVVDNQGIRSLGNLPRFFLHPWGGGEGAAGHVGINASYYRPVTTSLFALEYALFGLRPALWHLVSILLHAANTALVTLIAARHTRHLPTALCAGLLFATHPVHSEAIAAVSYQSTLLASGFALATLWLFIRGLETTGMFRAGGRFFPTGWLLLSLLAFLAKEEAIVLPLLAFAWVFFSSTPPEPPTRRSAWIAVGTLGAAAAFALLLRTAIVTASSVTYFGDAGAQVVLPTLARVITLYAELFLIPLRLCPFYDWFILPPSPAFDGEAILGFLLFLAALVAPFMLRKRASVLATSLAWMLLALLPVLHVIPILNVAAERFLYLPSLGFCIALALGITRLARRSRPFGLVLATILIGLYATRTIVRWPDWRDDRALNFATARDFSTPTPHLNLAQLEAASGQREKALFHLQEAEKRAPGWPVIAKIRAKLIGGSP